MLVIANNLSFQNREFIKAARSGDKAGMAEMAGRLKESGADMLNVSLSLDGDGDETYIVPAVEAVQQAGLPLSIDSRNPKAVLAAIKAATVPVMVNYVSAEEARAAEMKEIMSIAAANNADLVLYAMRKGTPADADERLAIVSDLLEMAAVAGIPDEKLVIDPVILHLGGGIGQKHAVAVQETLYGLHELAEPPIRTTCWLSNVSAGAPAELRYAINDTYLAMLAGMGLWSAYLDVTNKETMRTVRLIRALKDEAVYSTSDATL
ncbi:MAG: dihydropteroate synthase [Nitrospirae bacterium]|nr:dihydropteroate synthase [Nitrospirota bacterium]